ncbi:MAG: TlpA family protein disulfide reductase [Methylococcales bacterium]|nr:MAG: TlpA family protein disulfide reductase [Methylococcales bacterium]
MQKREHANSIQIKHRVGAFKLTVLVTALLVSIYLIIISLNSSTLNVSEVHFSTITGQQIALNSLQGKPVIVTFWATDCPECLKEIPLFVDLYQQFHSKGLEIIAVAMSYDPPNHVITLVNELHLPYAIALDLNSELAHAFGDVQLTPSTFLIRPDGSIETHYLGAFNISDLTTRIETLIKG